MDVTVIHVLWDELIKSITFAVAMVIFVTLKVV